MEPRSIDYDPPPLPKCLDYCAGSLCELPRGHEGRHQAVEVIEWPRDGKEE